MNKQVIRTKTIGIVSRLTNTDADTINDSTNLFADIGIDSLDFLEIEMEFEKKFGIDIPNGKLNETSTIGEIVDVIDTLLQCHTT